MLKKTDYVTARSLLLDAVKPVETERIALSKSGGRILAQDLIAAESIPPFDRSPYDGYAFRAVDTVGASKETPVVLRILEEVSAGCVPTVTVREKLSLFFPRQAVETILSISARTSTRGRFWPAAVT